MGVGGRGYEGCQLDPYYHTRGSIPCFSEKYIFDLEFNKYKTRSSDVVAPFQPRPAKRALQRRQNASLEEG